MADGGGGGTDDDSNIINNDDHLAMTPPPMNEESWRGCSMDEIHRHLNEFELDHIAAVQPTEIHTVLHHYPIREGDNEPPRPLKCHPKWDALHVRLPCSTKSQYPVTAADGSSSIESRWEMIEKALLRPITNSHELEASILAYNSRYDGQWNFRALHCLFEDDLDESETQVFFEDLLPRIIRLALRLPELVQAPIPLLKQGQTQSLTLTQQQISCLLANAFLCTFPRRNTLKRKSEYSSFPDINFNRLFQSSGQAVLEKIKCICHYFRRVCPTDRDSSNVPTGVVTFTRRSLQNVELPKWGECGAPLGITPLHITSIGTIEDQGFGLLQVDFANKFLGGGVLGSGCVQEEIRFVICPELLISKLFTECLRPTESLLMVGCERYSNYTGYAGTFQWAGNHEDATPRDSSRRRLTHIVAIDALRFVQTSHQYREELMLRELNKAYVGFFHPLKSPAPGVASGNWGCGAFGGEATLKALLQLMACTVTKRPLVYYTFGNAELRDEVHRMHTFFIEQNVRVKDLWKTLTKFQAQHLAQKELYNFIYSHLRNEIKHSPNSQKTMPQQKRKNNIESNRTTTTTTTIAGSSTYTNASAIVNNNKVAIADLKNSESKNKSQDIFASSSESENEIIAKVAPIVINDSSSASSSSVNNSQASSKKTQATHILISDDSATDALLLVAANEALAKVDTDKNTNNATNMKADLLKNPTKVRAELKQRSLLEMLDQCYTVGGGNKSIGGDGSGGSSDMPASKRHKAKK